MYFSFDKSFGRNKTSFVFNRGLYINFYVIILLLHPFVIWATWSEPTTSEGLSLVLVCCAPRFCHETVASALFFRNYF